MSVYSFVVKGKHTSNDEFRNIHYYEFPFYVPTIVQVQEAVDAIDAAYKTHLRSRMGTGFTYYAFDVRRVDVGEQPTLEYTATSGSWAGLETSEEIPFQNSALVSFKALAAFPRNARTYVFGWTENSNVSGGLVGSGSVTALGQWGAAMLELNITGDLNADKQSVEFGGVPRAVVENNDVTEVIVGNVWATQRRRRRGVGI